MTPSDPPRPLSMDRRERRARRWIAFGTTSATLGLAFSLLEVNLLSAPLLLLGLSISVVGLHRYGRLGPRQNATLE